jgi:hypothetical protein
MLRVRTKVLQTRDYFSRCGLYRWVGGMAQNPHDSIDCDWAGGASGSPGGFEPIMSLVVVEVGGIKERDQDICVPARKGSLCIPQLVYHCQGWDLRSALCREESHAIPDLRTASWLQGGPYQSGDYLTGGLSALLREVLGGLQYIFIQIECGPHPRPSSSLRVRPCANTTSGSRCIASK